MSKKKTRIEERLNVILKNLKNLHEKTAGMSTSDMIGYEREVLSRFF